MQAVYHETTQVASAGTFDARTYQAPFPWMGGKSRVAEVVWERFGNVPNLVEPFFGSGAVLFLRPIEHEWWDRIETVNDYDGNVANFWRAVKLCPEAVADWADWPVNECLPAGTMIATPEGAVAIEDVRAGQVVFGRSGENVSPTTVLATRKSITDAPLVCIANTWMTGNHPVWTREHGYLPAAVVPDGATIGVLPADWPVDEYGLNMLYYRYGKPPVGSVHPKRPEDAGGAVCGGDIPGACPLPRALVARSHRGKNAPGLLDSIAYQRGREATVRSGRTGSRGWVAGSRKALDCAVRCMVCAQESH